MSIKETLQGSGRALGLVGGVMALALGGGVYLISKYANQGPSSESTVTSAPKTTQTATGESGTEKYRELIAERNRQSAEEAKNTGGSALITPRGENACMEALELKDQLKKMREDYAGLQEQLNIMQQQKMEMERRLAEAQRQQQYYQKQENGDVVYYDKFRDARGQEYMTKDAYQKQRENLKTEMLGLIERMSNPPTIGAVAFKTERAAVNAGAQGGNNKEATPSKSISNLAKPGEIYYATLDVALNSDVPGPVLATIQNGKLKGARLLGKFAVHDEYMVVEFNQATLPDGRTASLQAFAIDPATTLPGVADDVDHHYLTRFGAIAGAAFLQGYGKALSASKTQIEYIRIPGSSDVVPIQRNNMNDRDIAIAALADVGQALSQVLVKAANRPPTVVKYAGSDIGILIIKEATAQ